MVPSVGALWKVAGPSNFFSACSSFSEMQILSQELKEHLNLLNITREITPEMMCLAWKYICKNLSFLDASYQ